MVAGGLGLAVLPNDTPIGHRAGTYFERAAAPPQANQGAGFYRSQIERGRPVLTGSGQAAELTASG